MFFISIQILNYWQKNLEHSKEIQDSIQPIKDFYQQLLQKQQPNIKQVLKPLARRMLMLGEVEDQAILPLTSEERLGQWGHINPAFGLTPSMREVLHHVLALQKGECLAVEGSPGTGKTTFIQSAIASLWTNEALAENKHAPVILVSSVNHLATRNMLDLFHKRLRLAKKSFPDHPLFERVAKLDQHWLMSVKQLGTYCALQSRQQEFQSYQLITRPDVNQQHFQSNWLDLGKVDEKQLHELEANFLQKCEQYFDQKIAGINEAKVLLHQRLQQVVKQGRKPLQHLREHEILQQIKRDLQNQYQVDSLADAVKHFKALKVIEKQNLSQIQQVREEWYQYQENLRSNIMNKLIQLPWIGSYFQGQRNKANRYFLNHKLPNHSFSKTTDAEVEKRFYVLEAISEHKIKQHQTEVQRLQELIQQLDKRNQFREDKSEAWKRLGFSQSLEKLESQLDQTYRVVAFWLATHYWEARYLLAVRQRLECKETTHQSAKSFFRELAMISPFMVMTLHSVPHFFQDHSQHLYGFADLLIIDDANQALPEIAFPAFALAKKALVMGDIKQLPPIRIMDHDQDQRNLIQSGLDEWIAHMDQLGISHSQGSTMKWAKRLNGYVDKTGAPFQLREHVRCHSKLAQYFNQTFYQNQFTIHTNDQNDFQLPALACVHIKGTEEIVGDDRINHFEAVSIALWVKTFLHKYQLYNKQRARETIAVITPYQEQANVIKHYLKKLNIADMLTVGTVYSLQGMEKEVIVFSATYTSLKNQEYLYDRDQYVLNVTVSRAKQSFLIFGDMDCFGVKPGGASRKLKSACIRVTDQIDLPKTRGIEQLLGD